MCIHLLMHAIVQGWLYRHMFMYYTGCYFTGIFYAVVGQMSMLFIDNKDSVFGILYERVCTES